MALSILILCIVSMTSFNLVTSSSNVQLSSDSAPLSDFGFSQLIDELVSANNDSYNRDVMFAVFAEVENQSEDSSGYYESTEELFSHGMRDTRELERYRLSAADLVNSYKSIKQCLTHEILCACVKDHKRSARKHTRRLRATLRKFRRTSLVTGKNHMDSLIENINPRTRPGGCSRMQQSLQYAIYNIYHDLTIIAVKGYTMRIYAYNLLRQEYPDYIANKELAKTEYQTTVRAFQKSAAAAMTKASREICSSNKGINGKGSKFIRLKWLFNTIVTNEAYLNEKASCSKTCDYYQNTTFHQYAPAPLDELNICHGRIYNCFQETVDSYCPTEKNSRRFDGLMPKKMGKTNCSSKHFIDNGVSNRVFNGCEQCICYCDDYDRSDTVRKFSLRAVKSDTSKNRVITGIQFVEKKRTIYLKIQDGELRPNGIIDKSTVKWQPVNEIDWNSPFISTKDFFTITYDKKIVNLDTLVVPIGRVLTGIKLDVQGSHLALKIGSNAFNYSTGILQGNFRVSNAPVPRQEIMMTAPDNPAYMNHTVIDKRKNTYVTFGMTDLERDAGQTAIPFIDAQPVFSNPPSPLSGAGIYYSGQTGYIGFIGLKAVTYDFANVIGN